MLELFILISTMLYEKIINASISLAEQWYVPDSLIKAGIRYLCTQRLRESNHTNPKKVAKNKAQRIEKLKESPIALVPEKANEQHYEVPPRLFELCLWKHLKYSSWLRKDGVTDIDVSEEDMLASYVEKAEITDKMDILELWCGRWSLTFYLAKQFPHAHITTVSNSKDQKAYIDEKCKKENITNIQVITADMNNFTIDKTFDRVISIEMFEHMRNYQQLLKNISGYLKEWWKLFVHIFSHAHIVYAFEDKGPGDWMAREFFSWWLMPSHDLLLSFQDDLTCSKDRKIAWTHYMKTSYARLANMDANKDEIMELFTKTYWSDANIWFHRRRIFFMACGELFWYKQGSERWVSHYLFEK